ncbi:IgGFc-binding protein-like [Lithobates pipiens]
MRATQIGSEAMGSRLLLHICVLLCLGGGYAEDPGTDFAFVFMQNFLPGVRDLNLEVLLTAFFPGTQATIHLPNIIESQVVSLEPMFPLTVELPAEMEILHSTRSNNIVRITSNKPISVVATNSKHYKTSVTVLTPIADWGTDYYVMTPDIGPEDSFQQMAIVNGPQSNFVSILLRATVAFEDTVYLAGEHLNLTLNPWETVQLQANESLTGSHVLSQEPIALFSGRTCAEMHGRCQVCFQLPPVSAWGSKFVSPPLPFKKFSSKIYILAATTTEVNIVRGLNMTSSMMTPGVVEELDFDPMALLLILSPGKILVLLYVGENLFEPSEGFLFNLVPREKACSSYSIVWVPGYRHTLLVVAQEDGREGLHLNYIGLPQWHWKNIPGTDLGYTLLPLDEGNEYYTVYNPRHVFGVGIIGIGEMNAYGAFGVCLDKDHACPPNSYYSMCAPGCPATCDVNFSLACPVECQEGCVCNPGYVLGDGGCILEEECGCYVDGQVLKHGEAFYGDGCQVACTCMHGEFSCANHNCSAIEACQTIGGITACYPKPISCWVAGEKHRTFDGASFIANGECLYTMVTTECASSNITDLDVKFQLNSNRQLPNIRLKIRGHTIIIQEYSNGIEVDGIAYTLPFELENGIRVSGNNFRRDPYIRIEAEPGLILIVSFLTVWVNLPPAYAGKVCGLCGNANGDDTDDTEGWSPQDFLSNWTSHRGNNLCGASPEIFDSDVDPFNMTGGDVDLSNLTALCDEILMPEGAFRNCHDVLSPTWFFHTCLNYVSDGLVQSVCSTIKDYAFECQTMGVSVYQWEKTICDHFGA